MNADVSAVVCVSRRQRTKPCGRLTKEAPLVAPDKTRYRIAAEARVPRAAPQTRLRLAAAMQPEISAHEVRGPPGPAVFHCPRCKQAVNLDSTKCAAHVRGAGRVRVTVAGVLAGLIALAGAWTFSRAGR